MIEFTSPPSMNSATSYATATATIQYPMANNDLREFSIDRVSPGMLRPKIRAKNEPQCQRKFILDCKKFCHRCASTFQDQDCGPRIARARSRRPLPRTEPIDGLYSILGFAKTLINHRKYKIPFN